MGWVLCGPGSSGESGEEESSWSVGEGKREKERERDLAKGGDRCKVRTLRKDK